MKKYFATAVMSFLLMLVIAPCFAQKKPGDISSRGHWQLVSNIHDKKTITVQFYTDQNNMIYEEKLTNARMNTKRRKIRRQLNLALEEAYNQWTANMHVASINLIAKRK